MDAPLSLKDARALLGVEADADARALRRAWARALQAARPDLPGGDEGRYRRVIAAHRLLSTLAATDDFVLAPAPWTPPTRGRLLRCELLVSPAQADVGAWRVLRVDGSAWRIKIPPGAADGLTLRLKDSKRDAEVLVVLRVPRPQPSRLDGLRRRFAGAWAA